MEDSETDGSHGNSLVTCRRNSPPHLPEDSPRSSVSSRLQEEYTELLKYTINSVSLGEDGNDPNIDIEPALALQNINNGKNNDTSTNACSLTKDVTTKETSQSSQKYVDSAVTSMATKLDSWLGLLKDKILAELTSAQLASLEEQNKEQRQEMNVITAEKMRLEREMNKLNETINAMEQSIARKDTLIENLTESLGAQKDKTEQAQIFYNWKSSHSDLNREKFTEKLAIQHHNCKISSKVFKAWFGLIQGRWRNKVERVCQDQASNVCLQLTNDYEAKISSLNGTIMSLEAKLAALLTEKEAYADQVKKAFMRGVCALNMEAMSAFNPDQQPSELSVIGTDASNSIDLSSINLNSNFAANHPSNTIPASQSLPPGNTMASLLDMNNGKESSHPMSLPYSLSATAAQKAKVKSSAPTKSRPASAVSKPKSQSVVLAPPMASVVVERHQPITKQTIGKATAIRYPKQVPKEASSLKSSRGDNKNQNKYTTCQHFKPLAGQPTNEDLLKTQAMSIKVVD